MNRVFEPALFPSDRASALRCGRAPAQWARDLSRRTERLAMMRRACGWVGELAKVRLRLRAGPLLGRCLADMTGEAPRPPSVVAAQPLGGPKQFAGPELAPKGGPQDVAALTASPRPSQPVREPTPRLPNSLRVAERSQSAYRSKTVRELQRRAEVSLLRRVAGLHGDDPGGEASSRESLQAPRRSPHTLITPSLDERMKRREWRDLMAQRAAGLLLRDGAGATQATSSDMERQIVSLALTEQWLMPPGGAQAPAETLARLANVAQPLDAATGRAMERAKRQPQTIPRSSPHLSEFPGRPDAAVGRERAFADPPSPNFASRHLENTGPPELAEGFRLDDAPWHGAAPGRTADTTFPTVADPRRLARSREDGWLLPTNIAPPTLTPSLPPLRPPRASETAPLPVAAATAHQGARQEEVMAQEKDLSLLAAQLKRILNDEARRHGIDV